VDILKFSAVASSLMGLFCLGIAESNVYFRPIAGVTYLLSIVLTSRLAFKLHRPNWLYVGWLMPFLVAPMLVFLGENRAAVSEAIKRYKGSDRTKNIILELIEKSEFPNDLPDRQGNTPLACAVLGGWTEFIDPLLSNGADPNLGTGEFKVPPIIAAVLAENIKAATVLLNHGADINLTESSIKLSTLSALLASWSKPKVSEYNDFFALLIENGASVNQTPLTGQSPVWLACKGGIPSNVLEILLAEGGNPNLTDASDVSPLAVAIDSALKNDGIGNREDQLHKVRLLIAKGADINIENHFYKSGVESSARAIAEKAGDEEIISLLKGNIERDKTV